MEKKSEDSKSVSENGTPNKEDKKFKKLKQKFNVVREAYKDLKLK